MIAIEPLDRNHRTIDVHDQQHRVAIAAGRAAAMRILCEGLTRLQSSQQHAGPAAVQLIERAFQQAAAEFRQRPAAVQLLALVANLADAQQRQQQAAAEMNAAEQQAHDLARAGRDTTAVRQQFADLRRLVADLDADVAGLAEAVEAGRRQAQGEWSTAAVEVLRSVIMDQAAVMEAVEVELTSDKPPSQSVGELAHQWRTGYEARVIARQIPGGWREAPV